MTGGLQGRRVIVTRAKAQAGSLCDLLASLGAHPILFPTIEIAPLDDPAPLDRAINALDLYDWVIFTSVNGVIAFMQRLKALGRNPAHLSAAAIGPATAQALMEAGIAPRFVPSAYVAEAIAAEIGDVRGKRILLPRAELAREALAVELARRGALVDEIASYRTLLAEADPQAMQELQRGVDAILFTSSSTVRNFVELAGRDVGNAAVACIGPITAQTARDLGLRVDVVADEYTTGGLVQALAGYFQAREKSEEKPI
ncbi:MAG: uroporphyrinogen-III synthase [Chloroflexi bacterium]|nr:uroporphyrinogen-III synthase [Chloroflexota bacterium]